MDGQKQAKVKNKAPAPIQITAEQLLREASERIDPTDPTKRIRQFIDNEDRADYQLRNRTFFEEKLRRNRHHIAIWLRYAAWEESQSEWKRARSVYERALDIDAYNLTVYLKYGEMEMRLGHVALARNLWDRATTILPRVDQFWYKYVLMEETLGELNRAREVWERWMAWQPGEESIWLSYIKFEKRHGEVAKARHIFERLVASHRTTSAWLAYAKFCEDHPLATGKSPASEVRRIFERAIQSIDMAAQQPKLFIEFARFETRQGEYERARVIYRFALDRWPKSEAEGLWNSYAQFERQHGSEEQVSQVVLTRRRAQYLERVANQPRDYDAWVDLIKLEEDEARRSQDWAVVREVYERAIANVPPSTVDEVGGEANNHSSLREEKRLWRRYIYLWIYYATFEEVEVGDIDRALAVYRAAVDLIPHQRFTFAKIWLGLALIQIRKLDVASARKILGTALGLCPKPKLFTAYIELEMQLREFDRCRRLYERFLEWDPARTTTWLSFAELERLLGDDDRARALYELAISETTIELDNPETLWTTYIEWETEEGRWEVARELWERLIERSDHLRVWISYAAWQARTYWTEDNNDDLIVDRIQTAQEEARKILGRAMKVVCLRNSVPERVWLLEAWKDLEVEWAHGDESNPHVVAINTRQPRKEIRTHPGTSEEYIEYIFPEDEAAKPAPPAKLLDVAKKWKKSRVMTLEDQ